LLRKVEAEEHRKLPSPTSIAFEGKIANNDNHKKYAVKKGE